MKKMKSEVMFTGVAKRRWLGIVLLSLAGAAYAQTTDTPSVVDADVQNSATPVVPQVEPMPIVPGAPVRRRRSKSTGNFAGVANGI